MAFSSSASLSASSAQWVRICFVVIAEFEKIVKQLEEGELPLDKSLALFERGVELSRYCHEQLGAAQRRIELLTERGELKDAAHLVDPDDDR